LGETETTGPVAEPELTGPTLERQCAGEDQRPKSTIRFLSWLGRQSLPRMLGLLFGNTRELEKSLERAEGELSRLRGEYVCREAASKAQLIEEAERAFARESVLNARFDALVDSQLMSRGMLPMTAEARGLTSGQGHKPIEPRNSPRQMEMEAEADRLLEMLQRGDMAALNEKVEDMLQSNRPQDKRVLQLFDARAAELEKHVRNADLGMEVIVGPPEARIS